VAEHLVTSHHADEAKPLFAAVRDTCPRAFIEYDAAEMERFGSAAKTP